MVNVVAANNLSYYPPGTAFHYSNTGYSILGKIVERVSGLSYASFVEQSLLKPNGLAETSFPSMGDQRTLPSPFATGYVWIQGQSYEATLENMSPHVAEGNVITASNDLAQWTRLLYSAQAGINKTNVDLMKDVKPTGEEHGLYGLGTTYLEGVGFGHNGAHAGYLTVTRYDPEKDVTIVVFASVINAEDIYGQIDFMYDLCFNAKQLLEV
jgi:D-alanyl-D-alanine carboxypeptidase